MNNATSSGKLIIDESRCFTQNIDDHPPIPKFIQIHQFIKERDLRFEVKNDRFSVKLENFRL